MEKLQVINISHVVRSFLIDLSLKNLRFSHQINELTANLSENKGMYRLKRAPI